MDIDDKSLNEEYKALKPEEKENASRELWKVFVTKDDLPLIDIINISAKYFISEPVLFCIFKEFQMQQKKS